MIDETIQAAFAYFEDNGHNVHQVITRGRRKGLTEPCIIEGIVKTYQRIQSGDALKPIQIVWEAWEAAKKAQGKDYLNWCRSRGEYTAEIDRLRKRLDKFEIGFTLLCCVLMIMASLTFNWLITNGTF